MYQFHQFLWNASQNCTTTGKRLVPLLCSSIYHSWWVLHYSTMDVTQRRSLFRHPRSSDFMVIIQLDVYNMLCTVIMLAPNSSLYHASRTSNSSIPTPIGYPSLDAHISNLVPCKQLPNVTLDTLLMIFRRRWNIHIAKHQILLDLALHPIDAM